MKINTKVTNLELTPAISDYLMKKLSMLEKFIDPDDTSVMCDVEIGKTTNHHRSGDIFRAEVNMRIARDQIYTVVEKDNLYAAIDEVKDETIKLLKEKKSKKTTLLRRGGKNIKRIVKRLRW